MNALLITFSFPPAGGVGVLRALSLAKYLPESGCRVDVLTARNAPSVGRDESLLRQVPDSVKVHRTWTLDLPFGLRKWIKKRLSRRGSGYVSSSAGAAEDSTNLSTSPGLLQSIRSLVANLLLPDPQIGWLPFAVPAARGLVRSRQIDVVIITVPPFSSVRIAARLRKAFPALPIVVDFRDEWLTTTLSLVSFNKNERAREVARQTESEAVHAATAVVAVTHAAAGELRARYPAADPRKFHCIPNGFDSPARQSAVQPGATGRVVLTYIGSLYGSTDPRSFLAAIAGLPKEVRAQLRIRFIGHIETSAYRDALNSLADVVETVGFLPQAKALEELRKSHYALLITHDPINVSAKFYDYLGAGMPIVAAVHPAGEVRRLIDETRAGWWANIDDAAAIQRLLIDAIARAKGGAPFQPNGDAIAPYHRKPLAGRYAALLHEIVRAELVRAKSLGPER
jgi:glycosyltransferase involved in cell wall biosynthesis